MTYIYKDAVETLAVILEQYNKKLIAECLAAHLLTSLPKDGTPISIKEFDSLSLLNNNGKFSIKIGNEE
jgi:hypothetical protein